MGIDIMEYIIGFIVIVGILIYYIWKGGLAGYYYEAVSENYKKSGKLIIRKYMSLICQF